MKKKKNLPYRGLFHLLYLDQPVPKNEAESIKTLQKFDPAT